MSKYSVAGNVESECEQGSNNQVLKNLMRIKAIEKIEETETILLLNTEEWAIANFDSQHKFTVADLKNLHKNWLGQLYQWAGTYRTVDMVKEGFAFAHAKFINNLMQKFEKEYLSVFTPGSLFKENALLAEAIAKVHVEFVLIHPFREGNGRLGRLLANITTLQARGPRLNFASLDHKKYIEAIHCGMVKDYKPMTKLFYEIICASEQA